MEFQILQKHYGQIEKINKINKVTIIGAGSYGHAISIIASHSVDNDVTIWARSKEVCDSINEKHINPKRFSDIPMPEKIKASNNFEEAVKDADIIVHCIPTQFTPKFFETYLQQIPKNATYVSTCKGIVVETHQLVSDALEEKIKKGKREDIKLAYLSGPSFAKEMVHGHPMGVVVASHELTTAQYVQKVLASDKFRIYVTTDVIGVEVGGAIKNPLAIGAGICQGMKYGQSTISVIVTIGCREMRLVCDALGGNPETLAGLSGIGDLMLTCFSSLSRNNRCGKALATGKTVEQICKEMGEIIEGVATAQEVIRIAQKHKLNLPLFEAVAGILRGDVTPQESLDVIVKTETGEEKFLN